MIFICYHSQAYKLIVHVRDQCKTENASGVLRCVTYTLCQETGSPILTILLHQHYDRPLFCRCHVIACLVGQLLRVYYLCQRVQCLYTTFLAKRSDGMSCRPVHCCHIVAAMLHGQLVTWFSCIPRCLAKSGIYLRMATVISGYFMGNKSRDTVKVPNSLK